MEREEPLDFNLGNHREVNQIPYSTTAEDETLCAKYNEKQHQEELRLKDEHISDLQLQLDVFLGVSTGNDNSNDNDNDVTRLKKSVSSLLEKLRQVRRQHVDETATLQKQIEEFKQNRAFDPTYHAEAQKVLHEKLESLAMRVDELKLQLGSDTKVNIVVVASEDDVQTLKDATILRCMFEMKIDVLNNCMNNESLDKEQRETAEKCLHEHWVGQNYLITQLQTRLMWYNLAHNALYKKLMKKWVHWTHLLSKSINLFEDLFGSIKVKQGDCYVINQRDDIDQSSPDKMTHRDVPPVYYARELILDFITLFLIQAYDNGDGGDTARSDLYSNVDNMPKNRHCSACDNELEPEWKRCPFCLD